MNVGRTVTTFNRSVVTSSGFFHFTPIVEPFPADSSPDTLASLIATCRGGTFATTNEHPGSSGGYKAQTAHYDIMGRADETLNPTEISGGFAPYGDDYNARWQYTEQTYDGKVRPLVTTHPDSSTRTPRRLRSKINPA